MGHGDDTALRCELCDRHDLHRPVTDDASEEDRRDRLDALRARIRSGDLSSGEGDQLDQLVFGVAIADWRASVAARDFPAEVTVQRALSAGARATVAAQQVEAPTPISTKAPVPDDTARQQHRRDHPTAPDPISPARLRGHLDGLGLSREAEVVARIGHTEADPTSYEDGGATLAPGACRTGRSARYRRR